MSLTATQARALLAPPHQEPNDNGPLELAYAEALVRAMAERQQKRCEARLHPGILQLLMQRNFAVSQSGTALPDGRIECEISWA